ncbi:4-hydroxythreonine-4-phosphate dehydrogenase PdxA [Desulfobacca acetoxidans]|uniref:4-hydroxythreonine-4-phosphate dehydrogenase n=1 Tax=Desulfobacca acetoxidans (strain ATCC 700848 / DSM 11109 / ASRB2) TaxID=880072 RepID=F2NDA2_DESAR|nr:4-hydroxythreonine-4-phosphate dehydrogenase PdxA [Desulfobacca acetoxidans]AEB09968.1 4-hydroxythreonine-4-phosphate dehydrogenase [Desulfobacca acetoxidans DSM 11109]
MRGSDDHRPLLAVTMGDITGIGPEIIIMALSEAELYGLCRPLVLGDLPALEKARAVCGSRARLHATDDPGSGFYQPGTIDIMVLSDLTADAVSYGQPTRDSGAAMVGYILRAVELALAGQAAAVVTAPISKAAMHLGGYHYPGHTELLAERSGAREFAMMLAGGAFRVVLATIHCPLREVPGRLNTPDLVRLLALTNHSLMMDFGIQRPSIGVAALNPHASEGGLFGDEEARVIQPAVDQALARGVNVIGPLPADTIFVRHQRGEFDAVVVMYHDQGLIPLKLLHFGDAVNVTLGLPIIRTSVDHGTAYDLAGNGRADPGSLKAALRLAAKMAHARAKCRQGHERGSE